MKSVTVRIRRVRSHASPLPLPAYQSEWASGVDLCADIESDVTLSPMERKAIPTGFALELPPGFEGQIRPRSGLALKRGITCLNSPGTIDADYRGEVQVILANVSPEPFLIQRGDRIAQLVVQEVPRVTFEEVQVLSESVRGAGGFGSTGGR